MTPAEADRFETTPAAYVHIPFCSSVCPYCNFAVVAGRDDLAERYIAAVCAEIEASDPWRPLEAVYVGGGTPSHLRAGMLERVLGALESRHGLNADAEISLEANPEDFSIEKSIALRSAGFNRVSFGAQSFDDAVLAYLGRRHTGDDVEASVGAARDAGFNSVSIDLIFGAPDESHETWQKSLGRLRVLEPDHVSCYALTVEPGTPLGGSVRAGAAAPDPDVQADRYEIADRLLREIGLQRYEVSNWARPGHECRYNLTVWAQGEFDGYGNGAHGFRERRRYRNVRRVDAYIDRIESGRSARAGEDAVTGWDAELDRLFVGLRRRVGVAPGPGTESLMASSEGQSLLDAGVIGMRDGRLEVLRPLLTDSVHRSVLTLTAPNVGGDGDA